MQFPATFRHSFQPALAALLLSGSAAVAQPVSGPPRLAFGIHLPAAQGRPPAPSSQRSAQNQEHLGQWMERHGNLPLAQQQRELQNEPGFHDLPPQTQQRMLNNLGRLNNMSPEQRRRMLERNELLERLSPPQRQQWRSAVQQLGGLSPDRRRFVVRAFRDLRDMPEPQRQTLLNSDRFRNQFSDGERNTLSNLLAVEPYLPGQRSNDTPDLGR
jgi:hypothetical protein